MLKDKKTVRRLAWLLCLSLVLSLLPIRTWSTTVNAVPDGTVVFSDGVEAYNFKTKWTLTGSVMALSNAGYVYEGDRAMVLQSPTDTALSPAFAVNAGMGYTLSYQTRQFVAGAAGHVEIRFYDASGKLIGASAKMEACNVTEMSEKTLSTVAPTGATSARLYFDTPAENYFVDAMTVTEHEADPDTTVATEATEPTEAPLNGVVNSGFEDGLSNWNNYINATVVNDDKHSGDAAVMIEDTATNAGGYISQSVPAVAGTTIELSAWIKVLSAGTQGYMGIYGIGNDAVAVSTGTNSGWTKVSVSVVVPEGYNSVTIEIGSSKSARTTYLVDDVTVTVVGEEPEGTDPTTEATDPTVNTTPTDPADTLVFSDDVEAYNFKSTWTLTGNTMRWPPDPGFGYQGDFVMILQGGGDTAASPTFAAAAGYEYTLCYWTKQFVAGTAGNVQIRFYDASGMQVGASRKIAACGAADWTEVTLSAVAPSGTVSAKLYFDAPGENYVVDVITVTERLSDPNATEPSVPTVDTTPTEPTVDTTPTVPTEPTEPTEPPVFKDSFEEFYTPEGANKNVRIPNGWTSSNPNSAAASSAMYDKGYDGSWNLCIQDPSDKYLRSPITAATPGYLYTVTFYEKKYQPGQAGDGGYAVIVFVDANGNALKEYEIAIGTSKTWTQKFLYSKAPANAAGFYIEIGLRSPIGEPTYSIDDLAVYAYEAELGDPDVTQPTEPVIEVDPMKPLEDNFEEPFDASDANSGPIGWMCNDDSVGFSPMIALVKDALSYDGYYLRLQKAGKWSVQSANFPVQVGYAYTASFKARKLADNENFFGYVEISFLNTRGKIIETQRVTVGKTYGQWADESVTATAPIGAVKAYVVFALEYNDRRAESDFAIDNFVVTRSEEQVFEYAEDPNSTEPSEYRPIFKDSFESYTKPVGSVKIPTGWTASEQSAAMGSATYDNYDGTFNLVLQDRGDKWIKSPMVNATAGNIYYATFVEKKLQPNQEGSGGYIKVCFVGSDGKVIKFYEQAIGASKTWTELEVGGQAPEGTVQLYVEFGIANAVGAPSYSVDNLQVIEGKPSKPGQSGQQPSQPNNPGTGEDNAPTGDNAMLLPVFAIMVATAVLAVLVITKRKHF